jgi:hypothetical protein
MRSIANNNCHQSELAKNNGLARKLKLRFFIYKINGGNYGNK